MSIRGVVKTVLLSAICAVPFLAGSSARAAVDICTWTGGGVNEDFSNSANWTGCDNGNVPENGDGLIFPTSVDVNTVSGNNRVLNNDLVSAVFGAITVSGSYAASDYDAYAIAGNAFSLSGDVEGVDLGQVDPEYFRMQMRTNVTLTQAVSINSVLFNNTSLLTLSSGITPTSLYNVLLRSGMSGSSPVVISGPDSGLASGGPTCLVATLPASQYSGNFSGFSGALTIYNYGELTVANDANGLAQRASSIAVGTNAVLFIPLGSGVDLSLATPITFSAGAEVVIEQDSVFPDCEPAATIKTVTFSGAINASGAVTFYLSRASVVMSGVVTNPNNISVAEGQTTDESLTVGSTVKKSPLLVTTYTSADNGLAANSGVNQLDIVNEGTVLGAVSVSGGTLKGKGTVGVLTMSSGAVAPGLSPGCLTSGNLTYTGGSLEIELEGATVCTQYDQQIVNGTVGLGTATTLNILKGSAYSPALNSVYTIISNDASDAVTGTFVGLAQGATVVLGGYSYRISYTGGDGNDVTLTVVAVPAAAPVAAPSTGFSRLTLSTVLPIFTIIAGVTLFTGKRILARRKI